MNTPEGPDLRSLRDVLGLAAADQARVAVPARSENSESGRRIAIEVVIEIRARGFMRGGTLAEPPTRFKMRFGPRRRGGGATRSRRLIAVRLTGA